MPDTAVVSVAVAAASCASAVLSSSGVAMLKNLFDEKFERVSADSWSSRPEIIDD